MTTTVPLKNNASIIKPVVSSVAEAEMAGCFYNSIDAIPIRIALEEMGRPQPPTPVTCDNSTAVGIANHTIKQRQPKPLTCTTSGSKTVNAKTSSRLSGLQVQTTQQTTLPNFSMSRIIGKINLNICTPTSVPLTAKVFPSLGTTWQ
jgi:hypothetical protein